MGRMEEEEKRRRGDEDEEGRGQRAAKEKR